MSSEIYSYIYEKALELKALDIYTESIYMKKNRPATKLSVICKKEDINKISKLILTETTTFGVRLNKYNRLTLNRKFVTIETMYGTVSVKIGYYNGEIIKATPEYEECKAIAKSKNIPLSRVFLEINSIIKEKFI